MKLLSSDGEVFMIDAKAASLSGLLVDFVSEDAEDDDGDQIPLHNVSAAVLKKVIEWAEHYKDDPSMEESTETKGWDKNFLKVDLGMLFELILAANYMKIDKLLDLVCQTVANMIKGKTQDEIRKTFNIKPNFVPSGESETQKENMEEDSAGLCGAAAGIGSESQKPVQSQQSETQNCQENN